MIRLNNGPPGYLVTKRIMLGPAIRFKIYILRIVHVVKEGYKSLWYGLSDIESMQLVESLKSM